MVKICLCHKPHLNHAAPIWHLYKRKLLQMLYWRMPQLCVSREEPQQLHGGSAQF